MTWLGLILCSAVSLSLYDLCKKHSASGNRTFSVLLMTTATGFVAVAAMLAANGRLAAAIDLPPRLMALLAAKSVIVASSWALAYWSLKTLPLTVMAPIRATGPIWTTLAALFIFSEIPTAIQTIGFVLAFGGSYAFSLATRREGFTLHTPSIMLAIGATLLGAASALYDKHLLHSLHIAPDAVLLWFMGGMTIIYAIASAIASRFDATPLKWRWSIPAVGILLAISDFLYFSAISSPDARISILSTIRRSSTILTFLIGGAVFRETNLLRKGIALLAILIGVCLLCI